MTKAGVAASAWMEIFARAGSSGPLSFSNSFIISILDKLLVNISSIKKRKIASVNITIFASYLCSSLFHARVRMIVCSRSVAVNKLSI